MTNEELEVLIRDATLDDVPAITAIYNQAIVETTATFDSDPKSVAEQQNWFQNLGTQYSVLVAVLGGEVVGWACLKPFSDRKAYEVTAETSFYVHRDFRGRRIGTRLQKQIVQRAQKSGFHSLIARVVADSEASLRIMEALDFSTVGTLKEVGRKFGNLLDVHVLQKMLS